MQHYKLMLVQELEGLLPSLCLAAAFTHVFWACHLIHALQFPLCKVKAPALYYFTWMLPE